MINPLGSQDRLGSGQDRLDIAGQRGNSPKTSEDRDFGLVLHAGIGIARSRVKRRDFRVSCELSHC